MLRAERALQTNPCGIETFKVSMGPEGFEPPID